MAQEKVQQIPTDNEGETAWRIDQPDVRVARKDYPDVKFKKYDEVIVTGGGCVQTGGETNDKTWRRYIDPSGKGSNRLYHGRIWIPGATGGLVRISSIAGSPLVVNKFPEHLDDNAEPSPYFLRLGYEQEDDKYAQNGYDAQGRTDNNQCKLREDGRPIEGLAWLEIRAKHPAAGDAPPSLNPTAPLDLWWDRVDDNFLPYGPDWWVHHNEKTKRFPNSRRECKSFGKGGDGRLVLGKSRECTLWDPDVDEPKNFKGAYCYFAVPPLPPKSVHGHVNWGAATYTGKIFFDVSNNFNVNGGTQRPAGDFVSGKIGDGDYDWFLKTQDDAGCAEGNKDSWRKYVKKEKLPESVNAIALEFSSRETVDKIEEETVDKINDTSWWRYFHKKVDEDPEYARTLVNGKEVIVIGLIGFDNEHGARKKGARVELHPVYGVAIQTFNTEMEDVWVILARNWGNEGACSSGFDLTGGEWLHYLALAENKMKFFLPARMTQSTIATSKFNTSNVKVQNFRDGVLVTIQLTKPEKKDIFWGEVRIKKEAPK